MAFIWLFVSILFFTPRKVECITTVNTYCSQSIEQQLQGIKKRSFWRVTTVAEPLLTEITHTNTTVAAIELQRTWYGTVRATVTEAEVLFPLRIENTDFAVRSNGALTPLSSPSTPIVVLNALDLAEKNGSTYASVSFTEDQIVQLDTLHARLSNFQPNITKIVIHEMQKIEVFPDGSGPVYMHIASEEELNRQLNTLQAIFHSTTMETSYQTLDIRFRDVIMK